MKQLSMLVVAAAMLAAGSACESSPTSPSLTPPNAVRHTLDAGTIVRIAFVAGHTPTQGEIIVTGAGGPVGVACWPNIRTDVVVSESYGKTFVLADQVLTRGTRLKIIQFEKSCTGYWSYFAEVN